MGSNSTRARSTDQAKGTVVDGDDGKGQSGGSADVECEHREKDADGVGADGGQARLRENQGWLTPNGRPSVHPSGDIDGWTQFAGVVNRPSGNAHTVIDRVCGP